MDGERTMNCEDARIRLLDYQRGRLPLPAQGELRAHLDTCPDCTRADTVEQELTSVLEHRLPQHSASLALKRRLAAQWPAAGAEPSWWSRWRPRLAPALAVAALVLVATPVLYYERAASRLASERAGMVGEAVNDHLRLLSSQHPLDVESGGFHQVKPWFAGRLDFAPMVLFEGDADFPLKGGAIGYFRDRKAAVFIYARRLHPISLIVFRADGLVWPAHDLTRIGSVDAYATAERGFNVILWRRGELGYALVSDVDARELKQLAAKMTGGS
jgi:anti-sigma factor RsiW